MRQSEQGLSLNESVDRLRQGEVVAYATESVFGLGCDPDNTTAVERLLALKKRPREKGVILIAASLIQLQGYIDFRQLNAQHRQLLADTWPGPVTWLLPKSATVSTWVTGKHDLIAVRVTAHPEVIALCQAFGKPLVSTSANVSGEQPAKTVADVIAQFGEDFPVLASHVAGREKPSEIRNILTGQWIRQG